MDFLGNIELILPIQAVNDISQSLNFKIIFSFYKMFSPAYMNMFTSSIIDYIDEDNTFGYCAFSNREEQLDLSIMEKKSKVIIFDTRTGYVNATLLVETFRDKQDKEFNKLTKMKDFRDLIDYIEDEINSNPHPSNKFKKCPNWDINKKYFKATYVVRQKSSTICCSGVYVHPDLISFILSWCNNKLMAKISRLTTTLLLNEGCNEMVLFKNIIEEEEGKLLDSISDREKITDIIKTGCTEEIKKIDHPSFDVIQYHKLLNYVSDAVDEYVMKKSSEGGSGKCGSNGESNGECDIEDDVVPVGAVVDLRSRVNDGKLINGKSNVELKHELKPDGKGKLDPDDPVNANSEPISEPISKPIIKVTKKRSSTLSVTNQAIVIIDNYDDGKCKYGSKLHKLSLLLIPETDLDKYVDKFSRQDKLNEEQLEEQLIKGTIELKSDIILKIISLRDVPQDFAKIYVSSYEDQIDIWLEREKKKQYLMTTNIEEFKQTFVDFIGDWMVI